MMVKLTEEIPHACTLRLVYTVNVNIVCILASHLYTAHDQISACLSVKPRCSQWLIYCIDDDVISLLLKLINVYDVVCNTCLKGIHDPAEKIDKPTLG